MSNRWQSDIVPWHLGRNTMHFDNGVIFQIWTYHDLQIMVGSFISYTFTTTSRPSHPLASKKKYHTFRQLRRFPNMYITKIFRYGLVFLLYMHLLLDLELLTPSVLRNGFSALEQLHHFPNTDISKFLNSNWILRFFPLFHVNDNGRL